MDRRTFVKGAAATAAGGAAIGIDLLAGDAAAAEDGARPGRKPNILVIKVDQLRFPTVFPPGIDSPGEFLKQTMPNLHALWLTGVKFTQHYTAACACTPARGTIISGLYSQQSWLCQTILAKPYTQASLQPWLNPAYPTYGKLLREAGYLTPYAGKWHVSIPPESDRRLEAYGFDGLSYYDPTGANLQGAVGDEPNGYHNDAYTASQGVQWLRENGAGATPWCLTVSFINPHDKEFFWAGTEFNTYNKLFPPNGPYEPFTYYSYSPFGPQYDKAPLVPWSKDPFKNPPPLGFPTVPPNWETSAQIAANKPSTQVYVRLFQELVWGGVADLRSERGFSVAPYPPREYPRIPGAPYGIGLAPFDYWQRSLDSYSQIMTAADQAIGDLLDGWAKLPKPVRDNTVIVFMSDHGEYAGAHGFLSGKVGTLYDEAFHVPLIVVDPTGRFAADINEPRTGLTSSVDVLPLLVSLGHGGSRDWLTGDIGEIYAERHDLVAMLRSAAAPGRPYVLLATDEAVQGYLNFNGSPTHILGMRTPDLKFGIYANWTGRSAAIVDDDTLETELYDYETAEGRAELHNRKHDPRIRRLKRRLIDDIVPNVLRARLPGALGAVQRLAKDHYLIYDALLRHAPPPGEDSREARKLARQLPFGQDF